MIATDSEEISTCRNFSKIDKPNKMYLPTRRDATQLDEDIQHSSTQTQGKKKPGKL